MKVVFLCRTCTEKTQISAVCVEVFLFPCVVSVVCTQPGEDVFFVYFGLAKDAHDIIFEL